jgi:hypothetical protein
MFKVNEKVIHKITGEIYTIESIDVYDTIVLLFTTCKKYLQIDEVFKFNLLDNLLSDLEKSVDKMNDELIDFIDSL